LAVSEARLRGKLKNKHGDGEDELEAVEVDQKLSESQKFALYKDLEVCRILWDTSILGDPGAVSGGRRKSKRARKNLGEEKSRTSERAPGDKVLTDQFQMVGAALASNWCQKTFVFFCPITEQQN